MELQELNSMLLEELLGISNKRLKYIFEGKTLDEESSTDEDQPVDVISLDDISDDDFVVISGTNSIILWVSIIVIKYIFRRRSRQT